MPSKSNRSIYTPKKYFGSKRTYTRARKLNERQKSQVKKIVARRMETKYYTSNYNSGIDNSGVCIDLCQVPYGDGDIARIGDEIRFVRLDFMCSWRIPADYNVCRLVLFQWRPLSTPLVGDIVDTNGPTPLATVNAPFFMYNWDNRSQYKILYSRIIYADYTHGPVARFITGSIYGKRVTKKIRFNSSATTPGYNHIYAMLITDDANAVPSGYPLPYLRTRLTYRDS